MTFLEIHPVVFQVHPLVGKNLVRRIHSRDHPGCEINFSEKFLEPVPLLSFPGSGNTWLRNLLEEISGIYSGSVYDDRRLYKAGFRGEFEDPMNGRTGKVVIEVNSAEFCRI